MKKHNIWFTSLLLVVWHTQAISQQRSCSSTFSSREEKFLNLSIKAEELINKAKETDLLNTNEDITQLQLTIDQQIAAIFEKRGNFSRHDFLQLKKDIETLENTLSKILSSLNGRTVNHRVVTDVDPTLINLIKRPDIVQSNVVYRIDWLHHGHPVYVIFAQKIIDVFFHPKKDSKNRLIVAKKNLKALQRGYTKGHNESGIKLLTLSRKGSSNNHPNYYGNKIFEIKTIGKISGHVRWGGFIDGDTLYVVHYSNNTHGNRNKHVFLMALWNKLQDFHLSNSDQLLNH